MDPITDSPIDGPEDIEDLSFKGDDVLLPRYRPSNIVAYHSFPGRTIIKSPFGVSLRVSYGIIVFVWKTRKWLLVKRAYTTNFLKIVEGSYRNSELKETLGGLTLPEMKSLKNLSQNSFKFNAMFKTVFPDRSLEELVYSKERFLSSSETIRNFIYSDSQPKSSVWQFPCLFSRDSEENPIDIALRALETQVGLEVTQKEKSFLSRDPFSEKQILGNLLDDGREEDFRYWLVVWMEEPKIEKQGHIEFQLASTFEAKSILDVSKRMVLKQAKQMIKENLLL